MQDSLDSQLHRSEGPECQIGWRISSPLMLSPTNELSNPFFDMTSGEFSHSLIFDLGMDSPLGRKHHLTPLELPLSLFKQDSLDLDYFSLDTTTIKRQRIVPSRLSTASVASSISSNTPSEADSDQDVESNLLHLNMASCSLPKQTSTMSSTIGLGFQVNYNTAMSVMPRQASSDGAIKVDHGRTLHQQQMNTNPSHASIALNSFNLSDFISDQEQEQFQGHQQHLYNLEMRLANYTTPEKPLTHRDVRNLATRSNSYSPISSNSPLTPGLDDNQFRSSPMKYNMQRDYDYDTSERTIDPHGLFTDRIGEEETYRPKVMMRSCTDPVETLSCNPSQITPNHQREMMEQEELGHNSAGYFFSLPLNNSEMEQNLFSGEDFSASPPSLYSSPGQGGFPSLWSPVEGTETRPDVFDGNSSPLFQHQEIRASTAPYPILSPRSQQPFEGDYYASETRVGAMRSARLSAMAAIRSSTMPYQSSVDQGHFDSPKDGRMTMPGIITKRSRGRRVPSNPDELNNLGKGGKVYTCKVPGCGKCFKRSEHLKRHVRSIHTNEKPFTCHCGKTFSRHDNLNQHARVHSSEGEGSPISESASLSPPASPMSLPIEFTKRQVDSKRASFSLVSSRLRRAINVGEEDEEEEEEELVEGNMFVVDGEDVRP